MAGGPLKSRGVVENSDRVWAGVFIGGGANGHRVNAWKAQANMSADTTLRFDYAVGPTLPSGQAKLKIRAMAPAVLNDAKIDVLWNLAADGEDASSLILTSEGIQTITWAAGDTDKTKITKVNLDFQPVVAGEFIILQVVFKTSGWTLAVISGWKFSIIFE